jgi:hypothetical protein
MVSIWPFSCRIDLTTQTNVPFYVITLQLAAIERLCPDDGLPDFLHERQVRVRLRLFIGGLASLATRVGAWWAALTGRKDRPRADK